MVPQFDFGKTNPTSIKTETVNVRISEENLFPEYAKLFVDEARRSNPLKYAQVRLTIEEMESYVRFLIYWRIKYVHNECNIWRKLKILYIPVWIQYAMAMVGEVRMRDLGLIFMPTFDEQVISFEEASNISSKVGEFLDELQIVRDAFPRTIEGDPDVMSTAIIEDYVRSIRPVEHVAATYLTAFMGMKLQEELAMKILYRKEYDDIAFIAASITNERGIFR
jgi:hypothetical protein